MYVCVCDRKYTVITKESYFSIETFYWSQAASKWFHNVNILDNDVFSKFEYIGIIHSFPGSEYIFPESKSNEII